MKGWLWRQNYIRGPGGPKLRDICHTDEEKPRKTSPRKLVRTGDRTRARCVTGAHATSCSTAVDKYSVCFIIIKSLFELIYMNVHKQNTVQHLTAEVTFVCSSTVHYLVLFVNINVRNFIQDLMTIKHVMVPVMCEQCVFVFNDYYIKFHM